MKIITYEKNQRQVTINLPPGADHLANLLRDDLEAEYAFEAMTENVVEAMNDYANDWLKNRGILL